MVRLGVGGLSLVYMFKGVISLERLLEWGVDFKLLVLQVDSRHYA